MKEVLLYWELHILALSQWSTTCFAASQLKGSRFLLSWRFLLYERQKTCKEWQPCPIFWCCIAQAVKRIRNGVKGSKTNKQQNQITCLWAPFARCSSCFSECLIVSAPPHSSFRLNCTCPRLIALAAQNGEMQQSPKCWKFRVPKWRLRIPNGSFY